jgi:hypothetical protein
MWPKSRPQSTAYQPIRDAEQQHDENNQAQGSSLWPTAEISSDKLLSGNNALKPEHLLGGNNKINQTLLLGGNKPIPEHLLLGPNVKDRKDELEEGTAWEDEDDDFQHLDYLEPTDDMPLTSRTRLRQRLPRFSFRNAMIAATLVVLIGSLIAFIVAIGGSEHPLGRDDYKQ